MCMYMESLKIGPMEKQVSCGKSGIHGSLPSLKYTDPF